MLVGYVFHKFDTDGISAARAHTLEEGTDPWAMPWIENIYLMQESGAGILLGARLTDQHAETFLMQHLRNVSGTI
jgi:hypothetical protein